MNYTYVRKLKKLIKSPGLFFRDYLNKRYPIFNNEQKIAQDDESVVVDCEIQQSLLESRMTDQDTPIDVVFTWVDSSDKNWQERYQSAVTKKSGFDVGLYADDEARFENHNELYYSVHSVLKYLDWVNQIFIVTDGQSPDWLGALKHDKITIINHHDIIDEVHLPTFNSHVIEAHLHKIPNLSENFIYFNDDVFVARPLPKTHFFAVNGNASIFLADKSLDAMGQKGVATPTLFACNNGRKLLNQRYGVNLDATLVHTYFPLKKSYFEKAWQLYGGEIAAFLPNRFRSNNDLNLATFFVPYLMYLEGSSAVKIDVCYYFNIRSNNAKAQYKKLLQKQANGEAPHSFCANDFNSQVAVPNFRENLESFLKTYFKIN